MRRKAADGMRGWLSVVVIVCACAMMGAASLGGCVFYLNPQCNDQISNGDETDIDCGGTCGRCDVGDSCKVDADCADSTCERGTCTAFACANGVQDEAETDVDCGGDCRQCAGGRGCAVDDDCFNGTCDAGSMTCSSLNQVTFADAVSYPSGDKTYALFSGDLDGDLDVDLVAANEQASSLSVFINDGTGVFQRLPNPFPTGDYPTGGVLTDMNGDDKLDVVTANYHGDSVSVLLNLGGGGELAEAVTYPTELDGETSNLAVGDLNEDEIPDVIATNPKTASISQFLGQGDGTLAPAVTTSVGIVGAVQPYSVAIGDFDGNGTSDVAIADLVNGPVIVKLGNGDGTYQPDVLYAAGGAGGHIIITTDIDRDGDLDLVFASRESNAVAVLLGRGDGTFSKVIRSSTGPVTGPYSIAVADFNLDGVPDVATANFKSNNATVLLGVGDGHFEPAIIAGVTGSSSYGTVAADLNGDGRADIATANANDNNVTVKLNTSQ